MSQVYVSGPTEVHVGVGAAGALQFFGWSENGVRINFDGGFEDVMSDVSGTRVPFDCQAMAMQAFITADMNVYNEGIYRQMANRVGLAASGEGAFPAGDVGYLMRTEAQAGASGMFALLVYSPYSTKGVFSTMDACYNFPTAYLADSAEMELSSKAKHIRCIFRAIPGWSTTTYAGTLFNHSAAGKPAPN